MASIHRRENGRWSVRWRDPDGCQRCRTFGSKPEAREYLRTVEREQATHPTVPVHPLIRLDEYAETWMQSQLWRDSTAIQVGIYMRRYVLPAFGSRPLASIRHSDVQSFVRRLDETLAPASVAVILAHLRSLMNSAVRDRLLQENPTRFVKAPKGMRRPVWLPSTLQVSVLRSALPPHLRISIDLAAGAGLRLGEVLGLTVDRVDLVAGTIEVDRQLTRQLDFGPPKSRAGVRTVPVSADLLAAIEVHVASHGEGRHGLVMSTVHHEPIKRRDFSAWWQAPARTAGVPSGVGLHCLRHYYASLLIRAGCSVKVVQHALGHATAAETLDTYAHLWPDDGDRVRAAVAAAWPSEVAS